MHPQYSTIHYMKEQRFNDKFPLSIVATLAVLQMLTTFAIFSLEVGHNMLHIKLTNLFAGFWTAIPFTVLWISMFAVVCCCRRRSCATHAVIQNILGFSFACALIGINIAFIRQPNKCFFTEGICRTLSWTSYISDPIECLVDGLTTGCGNTRISLIIAQLASGVVMAMTCLIYLIIYIIITVRTSKVNQGQVVTPAEAVLAPVYQSNAKQFPMSVSHHHQSCTISSNPYQGSIPGMMSVYSPQASGLPSENNYLNYNSPNQYATIYPHAGNERF
ncbi:unnamed protein product [Adineta steineri]|uniref:Uncharacterized protein n=1 Tax=Adineta steineri TaxID=433720 RepID=A0A815FQ94_9BILA|nr:unnamed protein product [Adineta steineri]CAF1328901.1 unnamed protein product [Adineta steineri]